MADEDDKVRRNLVVVSGVILATAFLELPVSGVIDLFAKAPDSFKSIPQSKLWALGLALLAYLLARYRFSKDGKDVVEVVTKARADASKALQVQEVIRAGSEFNLHGTLRPSIQGIVASLEELRESLTREKKALQKPQIHFNYPSGEIHNLSSIPFHFSSEHRNAPTAFNATQPRPQFSATFTSLQRLHFQCRSILVGYAYSEGAVQKLAPVIFAALAVMTLCFRIASRYLEHWPY